MRKNEQMHIIIKYTNTENCQQKSSQIEIHALSTIFKNVYFKNSKSN